jgi:hypothetical protein
MARILCSLLAFILSMLPLSSCGDTSSAACTPGPQIIDGVQTRQFCGPATASATVGGQSEAWSSGSCFMTAGEDGVDIGRIIIDPTSSPQGRQLEQRYNYFGAAAAATTDGTYSGTLNADYHGQDVTANGTVTLAHHLQSGNFTGQTLTGNTQVTAEWAC